MDKRSYEGTISSSSNSRAREDTVRGEGRGQGRLKVIRRR